MEILRIMSDLSISLEALEQARSQLPVTTYFDAAMLRDEKRFLFERGPRYVGHELWVPEIGNYRALPQEDEGRMLLRDAHGVRLLSNVCRHR